MAGFLLSNFTKTAPSQWWLIVHICEINSSKNFCWIVSKFYTYITDVLKLCMCNFDAEISFFFFFFFFSFFFFFFCFVFLTKWQYF